MKKAKTKNRIVQILSVILGAVFAFSVGFTFASNMEFNYGLQPKSTTAYLANQQYIVVNDTQTSPIPYGVGLHATDISLQYSYGYNFDVRVKYSLDWLGDESLGTELSTYNVELIFANRDNVIVDDEYIYYINYVEEEIEGETPTTIKKPSGFLKGDGKLNLIAGVEIIETNNPDYLNKTLAISIDEVSIVKERDSYSTTHNFYSSTKKQVNVITKNDQGEDVTTTTTVYGEAAKAWLHHKQSKAKENAYIMMYNYRYTNAVGVSYPGHRSAYQKTLENSEITGEWIGGNRAYAGVGAYIVTGSEPVTLKAKVVGTWRATSLATNPQYDNSIRCNYTSSWTNGVYDDNNLFETKQYNYIIPAFTSCYVEILDSIEITSAGNMQEANDVDTYRLVVRYIEINDTISFTYDTLENVYKITGREFNAPDVSEIDSRSAYVQPDVTIKNTSKYANNLFDVSTTSSQTFSNSSILLINNNNSAKSTTIDFGLNYYVGNGSKEIELTEVVEGVTVKKRATKFTDAAYFRYDGTSEANLVTVLDDQFIVSAMSAISVPATYTVGATLKSVVAEDVLPENATTEYDIWVELTSAVISVDVGGTNSNIVVEVDISGAKGAIKIKNNTNKIINTVTPSVKLGAYRLSVSDVAETMKPTNWDAAFWQYYYMEGDEPVQNLQKSFSEGIFYKGDYRTSSITLTASTELEYNNSTKQFVNLSLQPNESVVIYTFTKPTRAEILLSGYVEADLEDIDEVQLINSGVSQNYIVNYSTTNSYYVRFNGTVTESTNLGVQVVTEGDGYNYFITVVRPGQILKVASDTTQIKFLDVENLFDSSETGSLAEWLTEGENLTEVRQAFDNYFN